MSSFPYVPTSNIFNTADYRILDEGLTRATADQLYLSLGGGTIGGNLNVLGTLSINTVAVDLSLITGVIAGTSANSKALSLNASGVLDKLTLNYAGIGLDTPSLKFSGTTFDQSLYLNMIQGSAEPSKAVVLNSSRDISNINAITTTAAITTNFTNNTGSLLSYQNWSNTVGTPINVSLQMSSSGTRIGTTSNHNFRLMSNNGIAVFMDGSQNVAIGTATPTSGYKFDVSGACLMQSTLNLSSLANRTRFRTSTITSSGGIELYDDQFAALSSTMLNFKTGNNADPTFIRMAGYLNDNTTVVANGMPHDIRYQSGLIFCGGLNITAINTTQAPNNNYNVVLSARNGTIPHVVVNDQKNQLHLFPLNLAELNTTYAENVIIGNKVRIRNNLYIEGNNASIYVKSTGGASSRTSLDFEDDAGSVYEYGIRGSSETPRGWYWYVGSHRMCLLNTGRLGIGTTTPRTTLEVQGNVNQTTVPFGTNTYSYNVSNDVYTNHGGGPFVYSICAHFGGNIYVSNSVYNASDRRLKENIKVLDIDIEHYKKINPVSYNYKNDTQSQIGFIAQEMRAICGEAVSYADNENLKKDSDDDIEGVQMNIDYKQISVMNTAVIKKLIARIEKLESKIKR